MATQVDWNTQIKNRPTIPTIPENPFVLSTDYIFTETPNHTVGINVLSTITFTALPEGINAFSPNNHTLRIVDAVGGDETVLITAVVGTTIIAYTTLLHTGSNWTVRSATGGIQEAIYAQLAASTPAIIYIPTGLYYAYGTLYTTGLLGNHIVLRGMGQIATRYHRHSSFTAGNLIEWTSASSGNLTLENFTITNCDGTFNNTSGSGLYINTTSASKVYIINMNISGGYNVATTLGNGIVEFRDCTLTIPYGYSYTTTHNLILGNYYYIVTNCFVNNIAQNVAGVAAINVINADGCFIQNCFIAGYIGLLITPKPTDIFNFLYIDNNLFDTIGQFAIWFKDHADGVPGTYYEMVRISNNQITQTPIISAPTDSSGICIYNNIRNLSILGNQIKGWAFAGINITPVSGGPKNMLIDSNVIGDNISCGVVLAADNIFAGSQISNNIIGEGAGTIGMTQDVGIYFTGTGTYNGYNVVNNQLYNNLSASIFNDTGSVFTNCIINNNSGANDVPVVVASATSIDAPISQEAIILTGTATVQNITPVWNERALRLYKVDSGTISLATGGNFAATKSLTQYNYIDARYCAPQGAWILK